MPRRKRQSEGSLDSLLDTMTNVVGILVILLAVTQVDVAEAVKRVLRMQENIEQSEQVTQEQLAAATAKVTALRDTLEQSEARLVSLNDSTEQRAAALADAAARIERLETQVEAAKDTAGVAERAAEQLEAQQQAAAKATEQRDALEAALKQLEAQLESTPKPKPPPPKVVTLPNPRPAPKGIEPMYFICKGGRILPVPLDGLQKLAMARLRAVINDTNEKGEVDCDRMVQMFERTDVGNNQIRLQVYVSNYRPYLNVLPRDGAGETTQEIVDGQSRYRVSIFRANPETHYARFLVWPDSYETYVEARRIADERGMLAGWVPFYENQEWRTSLGVTLTCEGKPPPPPKPDKPDPPPATTKPKPPKRELPVDTVD